MLVKQTLSRIPPDEAKRFNVRCQGDYGNCNRLAVIRVVRQRFTPPGGRQVTTFHSYCQEHAPKKED